MKLLTTLFVSGLVLFIMSCQNQTASSEKSNNGAASDSAMVVAQKIIDYSNKLDFPAAFEYYSSDSDTRYIENGAAYPSLDAMKDAYKQFAPSMELLENKIKSWDIVVLNSDAVLLTLPIHARIKAKDRPEYQFDYVWSAVVQKRNGKWMLIQSHESWVNANEVMAAIAPPPPQK